jgi:flagellar capping protein FliD
MTVESLGQLLEEELSEAVEVKNPKSFHRFILLLSGNLVEKQKHEEDTNAIRGDIKEVVTIMRERFEAVDKRFESVDKRFESVDKRFEDMNKRFEDMNNRFDGMNKRFSGLQWAIGLGFTILAIMMTVYQYI